MNTNFKVRRTRRPKNDLTMTLVGIVLKKVVRAFRSLRDDEVKAFLDEIRAELDAVEAREYTRLLARSCGGIRQEGLAGKNADRLMDLYAFGKYMGDEDGRIPSCEDVQSRIAQLPLPGMERC